jgi:hypothetical protein
MNRAKVSYFVMRARNVMRFSEYVTLQKPRYFVQIYPMCFSFYNEFLL